MNESESRSLEVTPRVARTQVLRATAFVALWMGIGFAARGLGVPGFDSNVYILLGVPLTLAYQRLRKRPIRALWVREAHRAPRLAVAIPAALAAAVLPVVSLVRAVARGRMVGAAWSIAAVGGAVAFGYAVSCARRPDGRALVMQMLSTGLVGSGLMALALVARVFVEHEAAPSAMSMLREGAESFALYVPVCFVLEEVTFRGAVDDDLRDARKGVGIATAFLSSALWGLWHLPVTSSSTGGLAARAASLTVAHVILGVPLAIFHRRSGNLVGAATTHAFVDAVRNALVGVPS